MSAPRHRLLFQLKQHWLGADYAREGPAGNDITRTNVPDVRLSFRHDTLLDELDNIFRSNKLNHDSGWNLCATNVMLTSHTLVKEIIVKLIIEKFHPGS
ncbi:hypothetical protein MSG28_001129 [Choristoneura fumiferana]|uniref:Uncharacterized protein n=1 Tax=Choristoneura fumiferana TaxID=7141 RepID=A0ACC0K3W1_CHOFU|nr:hypothetical protein MSG28_001129 [Choristoneura fumiferana]